MSIVTRAWIPELRRLRQVTTFLLRRELKAGGPVLIESTRLM